MNQAGPPRHENPRWGKSEVTSQVRQGQRSKSGRCTFFPPLYARIWRNPRFWRVWSSTDTGFPHFPSHDGGWYRLPLMDFSTVSTARHFHGQALEFGPFWLECRPWATTGRSIPHFSEPATDAHFSRFLRRAFFSSTPRGDLFQSIPIRNQAGIVIGITQECWLASGGIRISFVRLGH